MLHFCTIRNKTTNSCILSLGSNILPKVEYIQKAVAQISTKIGFISKHSHFYQSSAWGKTDQDDFINVIIEIKTIYTPQLILKKIQSIENEIGRIRNEKWGPRIIDIDIISYNNQIINIPSLIIPHPEMSNRHFVLMPLFEIKKNWKHPISGLSVKQLIKKCPDQGQVEICQ